jgi:tetratricopeptide (TPR) repeat protein
MEKYAPKHEELIGFRAEAAALLSLPEELTPEQELAKADDVKLYTLVLEADPKAAGACAARGSAYAERGEWKEAAADFARAIELDPDNPLHQYRQAMVRLELGETAGYRKLCADMLARLDPAAKADSAHWIVWTCVLAADAVADWKIPLQLAEKAVADDPESYRALNQQGAVLYRVGQYQEALKRLTEAQAAYRPDDQKVTALAYNWLFLAMAYQRLGQVEEAQKWHDKASQWIDQEMQKSKEPAAANLLSWNRRLTLQLLRREAGELLKQK